MACLAWPLWMAPRVAVAVNLAQLVARESHSRLSRRKVSEVVPAHMIEWAMTRPSELASAPQAKGDPIGWAEAKTGARHYLYQSENGNVHQLSFDDKWTHQTLSPKVE